ASGSSCGTTSATAAGEGRLSTSPAEPSSLCSVTSTTARWKFGSSSPGEATSSWPVSISICAGYSARVAGDEAPPNRPHRADGLYDRDHARKEEAVSDLALAAVLAGAILLASTISVELGLSVALIELLAGVIVGNAGHVDVPSWLTFVGTFAGIVLTFQAGAEVDVPQLRREWKASVSIGLVSFFAPFAVVALVTYYALDWSRRQAEIGGLALSTTSLAVVYAVLVETGLNKELVGKRLMSATIVTDIATVTGLTVLFLKPTVWIAPFALVSLAL